MYLFNLSNTTLKIFPIIFIEVVSHVISHAVVSNDQTYEKHTGNVCFLSKFYRILPLKRGTFQGKICQSLPSMHKSRLLRFYVGLKKITHYYHKTPWIQCFTSRCLANSKFIFPSSPNDGFKKATFSLSKTVDCRLSMHPFPKIGSA